MFEPVFNALGVGVLLLGAGFVIACAGVAIVRSITAARFLAFLERFGR